MRLLKNSLLFLNKFLFFLCLSFYCIFIEDMFMSFTLHEALDTRWDSEIPLNCARCVRK
jgi:hypothetical protein